MINGIMVYEHMAVEWTWGFILSIALGARFLRTGLSALAKGAQAVITAMESEIMNRIIIRMVDMH
jgi:hypothetical protein